MSPCNWLKKNGERDDADHDHYWPWRSWHRLVLKLVCTHGEDIAFPLSTKEMEEPANSTATIVAYYSSWGYADKSPPSGAKHFSETLLSRIARVPLSRMRTVVEQVRKKVEDLPKVPSDLWKNSKEEVEVRREVRGLLAADLGVGGSQDEVAAVEWHMNDELPEENKGNSFLCAVVNSPALRADFRFGSVAQVFSGVSLTTAGGANLQLGQLESDLLDSPVGAYLAICQEFYGGRASVTAPVPTAVVSRVRRQGDPGMSLSPWSERRLRQPWRPQSEELWMSIMECQSAPKRPEEGANAARAASTALIAMREAGMVGVQGFYLWSVGSGEFAMTRCGMPAVHALAHCCEVEKVSRGVLEGGGGVLRAASVHNASFFLVTFDGPDTHEEAARIASSALERILPRVDGVVTPVELRRETHCSHLASGLLDLLERSQDDQQGLDRARRVLAVTCRAGASWLTRPQLVDALCGCFGFGDDDRGPGPGPWQVALRLTMPDVGLLVLRADTTAVRLAPDVQQAGPALLSRLSRAGVADADPHNNGREVRDYEVAVEDEDDDDVGRFGEGDQLLRHRRPR